MNYRGEKYRATRLALRVYIKKWYSWKKWFFIIDLFDWRCLATEEILAKN
jgi:hypothetical protein